MWCIHIVELTQPLLGRNCVFNLSDWSAFHIIDNLSTAGHTFACRMLMSFSGDVTLYIYIYIYWAGWLNVILIASHNAPTRFDNFIFPTSRGSFPIFQTPLDNYPDLHVISEHRDDTPRLRPSLRWRALTPLQRCNWGILRPHPDGLYS